MAVERLERKRVPTFGECIYCGKKAHETKLTDEHTMPFSLGGNVILENASCIPCADVTKRFEGYLGRKVFWDFRIHAGTQTRSKRDRPTKLPARLTFRDEDFSREFEIKDHPFFTVYPVWPVPGILAGNPPVPDFRWVRAAVFHSIPDDFQSTLGMKPRETAELHYPDLNVNSDLFARALLKIAYCTAVMRWGIHGFRPICIPDIILGKHPLVPHFVGTDPTASDEITPREVMHTVQFAITEYQRLALLTARVRLFSNSGFEGKGPPTYEMVVGAPSIGWRLTPNMYD